METLKALAADRAEGRQVLRVAVEYGKLKIGVCKKNRYQREGRGSIKHSNLEAVSLRKHRILICSENNEQRRVT